VELSGSALVELSSALFEASPSVVAEIPELPLESGSSPVVSGNVVVNVVVSEVPAAGSSLHAIDSESTDKGRVRRNDRMLVSVLLTARVEQGGGVSQRA
jgi:hypothetical protein